MFGINGIPHVQIFSSTGINIAEDASDSIISHSASDIYTEWLKKLLNLKEKE